MSAVLPSPDASRYLESIRSDAARVRLLAEHLDAATPVPGCPGWTVDHLVRHVADVYLRQSAAITAGYRVPPGDPAGAAAVGEGTAAYLDRGLAEILAAVDRPESTPCWTWPQPRGRLAFWQRRMALETLIHRVDLEQAAGEEVTIARDLALDGVDEVLTLFLPRSLPTDGPGFGVGEELRASVVIISVGASWGVEVRGTRAEVVVGGTRAAAYVSGEADALLLWLWGRGGDEALDVKGDAAHVAALRRALAAATR